MTPERTPGTSRGSQVGARNGNPKCAMGTGGWCSYGASDASTSRHRVYSHSHVDNSCSVVASTEAAKGAFDSAPWNRGSRGGAAEGKTLSLNAIFFRRPPIPSHVPLP